jgi:hypothetical protein
LPLYFGSFHFRCLEYKVHLINYSHGAETRFENIQQVIDFIIFYRVIISDKYELNETCTKSFLRTQKQIHLK